LSFYLPLKLKNPRKTFQGSWLHLRARCWRKNNILIAKAMKETSEISSLKAEKWRQKVENGNP
jgi:hypothetical protein